MFIPGQEKGKHTRLPFLQYFVILLVRRSKAQPRVEIAWCLTRMLVWAESGRGVGELGWRAQRRQPLLGGISSLDECYRMPGSFDGAGGRTSNRLSGAAWHNEGGVDESSVRIRVIKYPGVILRKYATVKCVAS